VGLALLREQLNVNLLLLDRATVRREPANPAGAGASAPGAVRHRTTNHWNGNLMKTAGTLGGLLIGALIGYPLSYFFQPGMVRAKMSIAEYVQNIEKIMDAPDDIVATAIGVWIASAVVFAIVGFVLGLMLDKHKKKAT
jgi:hypothetical protein